MPAPSSPSPQPLRRRLLILEFVALAVLLGSMAWFSARAGDGQPLSAAWLLVPALASLVVFASFIGLMYLRWVVSADATRRIRHKITFALLSVTLLGVWLYGIVNTWLSLTGS